MKTNLGCAVLLCVAFAGGCGSDEPGTVGRDAGSLSDAGVPDAGGDAGVPDAGLADAGPQTLTVLGKLVDAKGHPAVGLVALNQHFDQAVSVGADGAFTFGGVTPPYDLSVFANQTVYELRGLTRAEPTVVLAPLFGASQLASIQGTVTQPAYPLASGEHVAIGGRGLTGSTRVDASADFTRPLTWGGLVPTLATDLVALHYSVDAADHVTFLGSGTLPGVTLQDGATAGGLSLAADQPVSAFQATKLLITWGAYSGSASAQLFAVTVGGARFSFSTDVQDGDVVSLPSEGGVFFAQGEDAAGNVALQMAEATLDGDTALALPSSTQLAPLAPGNGAVALPRAATLRWTPLADASVFYVVVKDPGNANATVYQAALPEGTAQVTLPLEPNLGIGLSPNHTYSWQVETMDDPAARVDAFVDGSGLGFGQVLFNGHGKRVYVTHAWSFTTAP